MPRVLIVRGHLVTPWELRPWIQLPGPYEVRCLLTGSNQFSAPEGLRYINVGSRRDRLPPGIAGELAVAAIGDRYRNAEEAFAWAEIVHAEELSFWFSADAARARRKHNFRLVQTVWETLPMLSAFRNRQARRNRELVLAETDLFLPATERAALALRLEGVDAGRIRVCAPGIDIARFAPTADIPTPPEHTLISPGRLVWEKGHQDVLRALAGPAPRRSSAAPTAVLRPRLDHRLGSRGGTPARLRARARTQRSGAHRQRRLRRDARPLRFRLSDGAGQPGVGLGRLPPLRRPPSLLGGAVRDGPGRSDGLGSGHPGHDQRGDPRGAGRDTSTAGGPRRLAGYGRSARRRAAVAPARGSGFVSRGARAPLLHGAAAQRLAAAYATVLG